MQVHLPYSNIAVIILSILIFTLDDLGLKKRTAIDYTLISFGSWGFYFAEPNANHGWYEAESHCSKICRISWENKQFWFWPLVNMPKCICCRE